MSRRYLSFVAALVVGAGLANGQPAQQRRATITGGGSPDHGKCTLEVVVDGTAEISVRGDTASLKNVAGQPPQWRRFQCNAVMPGNPGEFHFQGIDGRGHQQLIRDPRNGGVAVVQIDDPQGGSEGYTFDLIWDRVSPPDVGRGNYIPPPPPEGRRDYGYDRDGDAYHRDREDYFRHDDWQNRLFQRVREDLYHVQRETFGGNGDRYRLEAAFRELDDLQSKLAARIYDEREVNDVLVTLRDVVKDNRLARPDREMLSDDLQRIRDYRDSHRGGR